MKKKFTRLTTFSVIVVFIFTIIIGRLVYLQIVKGDDFQREAQAKGEKEILELAPRGDILDKNGQKIATSIQSFNVTYSNTDNVYDNNEINNALQKTIRTIKNNGDEKKLNLENLPISIVNNKFAFTFTAKTEKLRVQLANNLVKNNNLGLPILPLIKDPKTGKEIVAPNESNLTVRAKDIFYALAGKYGLTPSSQIKDTSTKKSKKKNAAVKIDYNLISGFNKDIQETAKVIALRLAISSIGFSQYRTVYLANNVNKDTFSAIMSMEGELPGISTEVAPMRYYPDGQLGSAFLGYLGKISDTQKDKFTNLGYDINRELIGKAGLERVLENNNDMNIRLRGEPGFKYVDVDKFGRIIKQTAMLDPIPGDTVETTIDANLQRVAENALDTTMQNISSGKVKSDALYKNANRGAAVVVDVHTGEVLALASRPGFDPNWFAASGSISPEISSKIFPDISNDKYDLIPKPMFNYATMGSGPPGSTFKPLVAIAALQEKDITPDTIIVDRGVYNVVPGFGGACWLWNERHGTHGPVNLAKALQVSCNYFFFETGRRLGYAKFQDWAWKFGLASNPQTLEKPSTGIEIDESPGDVSSPERYKDTNINLIMQQQVIDYLKKNNLGNYNITKGTQEYKVIYDMFMTGNYDENQLSSIGIESTQIRRHLKIQIKEFDREANSIGQLLNASIGQGSTLLTPLQMVNYIATIVNGGNRYKLHLVKKVLDPNGNVKQVIQPEILNHIDLDPANVDAVKKGMEKVTEEGGTASSAFYNFKILTGGKTGSASVSKGQAEHGRSAYGWFIGFAPLNNPQIAVCVVIYDAGHGGSAAPVARAIYDQYFGLNKAKTKATTTGQSIDITNGSHSVD